MGSDAYLEKAKKWHERAKREKDPFVKFALEYIAFEALLHWRFPNERQSRRLIQNLKQDQNTKTVFLGKIKNIDFSGVIETLKNEPLRNVSGMGRNYWEGEDGILRNEGDYTNMVEFIYRARNNLFHGHKNPRIERDEFIVETANVLLTPLIDAILEVYARKHNVSLGGLKHEF